MGLHPFVHHTKLRGQALDIVLDIQLQPFHIQAVLVQSVQNLLFRRMPLNWDDSGKCVLLRLLLVAFEGTREFREVLRCQICHGVESSRLEILKAGVVEDLPDRALKCLTAEPGCNERTRFRDYSWAAVSFDERLRLVLLELICVSLRNVSKLHLFRH